MRLALSEGRKAANQCFGNAQAASASVVVVLAINAVQLKALLDAKENIILIDVLHEDNFVVQHIPGAINIPYDRIGQLAPSLLPDKNQKIVVYCSSNTCTASPIAYRKLAALGYSAVEHFDQGIAGWQEAGFPLAGTCALCTVQDR
jgi:rhodanese-related sulfurtransferase